ncbi:hypothetical protein HGG79_07890 [Clostridium tetanomorphum]|uniref:Uncharacterized protein n=1 Tax=Clostridium tetanomorphum TaxID=1553 RepID=A0A923EB35_CLOTT|nr:hypothetical protein [Clostridium tetanomorphum]
MTRRSLHFHRPQNIKEYWIVNPIINTIQIYSLNDSGLYDLIDVAKNNGFISSKAMREFTVDVEEMFK